MNIHFINFYDEIMGVLDTPPESSDPDPTIELNSKFKTIVEKYKNVELVVFDGVIITNVQFVIVDESNMKFDWTVKFKPEFKEKLPTGWVYLGYLNNHIQLIHLFVFVDTVTNIESLRFTRGRLAEYKEILPDNFQLYDAALQRAQFFNYLLLKV